MMVPPPELLSKACRLYLERAYPAGPSATPPALRAYWNIPLDGNSEDYLTPAPRARGICEITDMPHPGYRLRLGCVGFAHMKMAIQEVVVADQVCWLFTVDTHDSWHHPDHPDAEAWLALQAANRELKSRIEHAWEEAGLLTMNRLLRDELAPVR